MILKMNQKDKIRDLLLLLLALMFSVALMFAFVELPRWLDHVLQSRVNFPQFDQGASEDSAFRSAVYIEALKLRWIGYGSLILVFLFILTGFLTRKSKWAWAGAFILFLPVFGQFALSMFFLSGLGILRTGWLPMIESGFPVLDLGMVIYIPFWILNWFFGLFSWEASTFICWMFMFAGAFFFVWGVFVWFRSRFDSKGVATEWIYKVSRHPQYLGWIIWSYGFMLFSVAENDMKKSWGIATSFPWLLSTMIIIAICLIEELNMRDKYGAAYDSYRNKTPFLFPLPKWLSRLFDLPVRWISGGQFLETRKQVSVLVLIYTVLFMSISLIWVDLTPAHSERTLTAEEISNRVEILTEQISQTTERRVLWRYFDELGQLGETTEPLLIKYLNDPDPVLREFSSDQLGNLKSSLAVEPLIERLEDDNWRVINSAAIALSKIGSGKAKEPILQLAARIDDHNRYRYFGLFAALKAAEAWGYLETGLDDERWYVRAAALDAMTEIDFEKAKPKIFQSLKDEDPRVKRHAVFILLEQTPDDGSEHLRALLEDEDFETRFYARQTIKLIEEASK